MTTRPTKHRLLAAAFAAAFAAALAPASIASAQVCVNPAGGGCETTIQAGIDAATGGQTVTVQAGRYSELVTIPVGKNGLTLAGSSSAVLDNPVLADEFGTSIRVLADDVAITGLVIRNGDRGISIGDGLVYPAGTTIRGVTIEATSDDCIQLLGADDVVIDGSTFNACGDEGISADTGDDSGGADNVSVTKSTFRFCDDGCIRIAGDDATVSGNKIRQSEDGAGIDIDGNDALVEKNKISSSEGGIEITGDAPSVIKNKITDFDDNAIDVTCEASCSQGAGVVGNKAKNGGEDDTGFDIQANEAGLIVEKNSSSGATDEGFYIDGIGVIVTGNKSVGSGGDSYESGFEIAGSGHVVTGNVASENANDGFHVSGMDHQLTGNVASGNFGDGFDVDDVDGSGAPTGVTLTGNTASSNVGEGFSVETFPENLDPIDVTFTGNDANGNRVSFCDSATTGAAADGGDNSFTVAGAGPCEVDHD